MCPQVLLVLMLRPLGDSGDENGSFVDVYEDRKGSTLSRHNVIVFSFNGDTLMSELLYQLYLVHLQRLKGSMVLRVKRTLISLEEINCLPRVSNGKL